MLTSEEAAQSAAKLPRLPRHIAVIMDGNGRWAAARGLARLDGHRAGAKSVRGVVEQCGRLKIPYLTLYSFSTENWGRDRQEVSGLMDLFREYLDSELPELLKNGIRLRAIGDLERLPLSVRTALRRAIERTQTNTALNLTLAVSYGSRDEIVNAVRLLAKKAAVQEIRPDEITAEQFSSALWTGDLPDPDLLIRTSGEMRISNFLLWQIAYSELVVRPELWPDFDHEVFLHCLEEYARRERRYGRAGPGE